MRKSYWLAIAFLVILGGVFIYKARWLADRVVAWGQYRNNLIWVTGDNLHWVSWVMGDKQMVVFNLPAKMLVPVVGMDGELRSEVVWKFGEGESEPLRITRRSMELMFGARADGVVRWAKNVEKVSLGDLKQSLILGKSDLGLVSRGLALFSLGGVAGGSIKEIDIPKTLGVVEKLPDGSEVVSVDRQRLELILDDLLVDERVVQGSARLVLANVSGDRAALKLLERQIESVGGLVTDVKTGKVEDGQEIDKWCEFRANKKTLSENGGLRGWLKFKADCREKTVENVDDSEIKLTAGEDWEKAYRR